MAKNKNRHHLKETKPPRRVFLSSHSKKWLAAGILLAILGFWLLTFTDPAGQNWASTLSPFLLVIGYVFIGIGFVLPSPLSSEPASSPEPQKNS
ncbi:MAG: hypothetical protein WC859_00665 [Elusimicrobiota bacterium]|jgi:hypothetical protein